MPPASVAISAFCVALYGVAICAGDFLIAGPMSSLPGPLLRLGIILAAAGLALATGLWVGARWAWYAALAFTAWFSVAGITQALNYARSPDLRRVLALPGVIAWAVGGVAITTALIALLLPSNRAYFRRVLSNTA